MKIFGKEGCSYVLAQVHISCVLLLILTAYKCLESIQSSLNFEDGLGTISISLVYAFYFCSSLLVGGPVVYLLKPKWSVFVSLFPYTVFIIANIWPSWLTMVPSSILLGLADGPFWIAQGTYMSVLASRYAEATGEDLNQVVAIFSGIFHIFYGASSPIGNFISSFVLSFHQPGRISERCISNESGLQNFINVNASYVHLPNNNFNCSRKEKEAFNFGICGPNHCPYKEEHIEILEKPNQTLIYILMGILLSFNLLGIILTAFLKSIPSTEQSGVKQRVMSTPLLINDPNLLLLIIPFSLIGIVPGTFYASFAQVSNNYL